MLLRFYAHWRDSYSGIPQNVWILAFVNLVNRCGGMVISFITLYLTQQLHFDIRDAGYVMGCFGLGALTGAYAGGKLTDRIGYYPVLVTSLILNGIMLLVLMSIRTFESMCIAVFILALVAEIFRPANSVAVARYSEPANRTRSISLMRMAFNLGWTIAPVLGGILVGFGWFWLFWIDGLTCIAAALTLRWLLPPKSTVEEPREPVTASNRTVDSPYRDRNFLWFILFTFLGAVVFMQMIWTVPVFFKESYHWTERMIGMVIAFNGLVVFLVEMPLIFQIEGKRHKLAFVRWGIVLYMLSYLALNLPLLPIIAALMYMTLASLGEIMVMPFSSNYMYSRAKRENQGQYSALYTMSYSVSNIIAPLIGTQIIAHFGYPSLWYTVVLIAAVSYFGFWRLQAKSN